MPCSRCGDDDAEAAWSDAAQAALCERCYLGLDSARYRPPVGRVVKLRAAPKPEPGEFAQLVELVWRYMERDGQVVSMGTVPVVLVGRCPRCRLPMSARFVHQPEPDVAFACWGDCEPEKIGAALGRANE